MFQRFLKVTFVMLWIIQFSPLAAAQELVTSTPVRVRIPTGAAPVVEIVSTPTVTRTPTQTAVMLSAKDGAGEVNVRAEPDIESDKVGTIRAGEFYPVLGRYYRWIQFQFDSSPSGRGWVFDELVDVTGDINTVPDLSEQPLPTEDAAGAGATQTQIAITERPGGILTVTAESRIVDIPDQNVEPSGVQEPVDQNVLPTFTYPPDVALFAPTDAALTPTASTDELPFTPPSDLPPAVPIALLGAGGLLGLIVSALRR